MPVLEENVLVKKIHIRRGYYTKSKTCLQFWWHTVFNQNSLQNVVALLKSNLDLKTSKSSDSEHHNYFIGFCWDYKFIKVTELFSDRGMTVVKRGTVP